MSSVRKPKKGEEPDKDAGKNNEADDEKEQEEIIPPPTPTWRLSWIWHDTDGSEADAGEATATDAEEELAFAVQGAPDFSVPWNQIASLEEGDHRLTLRLHDGTALVLHRAGRGHDHLTSVVLAHLGEQVREEALAEEPLIEEFTGSATPSGSEGRNCRVLVYETALCLTFD